MKTQNSMHDASKLTLISIALSAALGGCAFIESHPNTRSQAGVSYYLPLRPVELTFTREATLDTVSNRCIVSDSLAVANLPMVADASTRYTLALNHHVFRSDKLVVVTTPAGLITTSNATAIDQTSAIIIALAQSQATVRSSAFEPQSDGRKTIMNTLPETPLDCSPLDREVKRIVNPKEDSQLRGFAKEITDSVLDGKYALSLTALAQGAFVDVTAENLKDSKFKGEKRFNGIAYRRNQSYVLSLSKDDFTIGSHVIGLPQGAPIEMLQLQASFGNTITLDSVFVEGMLTSHTDNRPSEALEIASIPYKVAKAALAVPAELLTLRTKNVTEGTGLTNALRAQICAQEKLAAVQESRPVNAALCIAP